MAVVIKIKQNNLIKQLDLNDIIQLSNLSYGISDNSYRIKVGKTGKVTILFDQQNLARGIQVSFDNQHIILTLNLPTTENEIITYYKLVKAICQKCKTNKYWLDDQMKSFDDIDDLIYANKQASINALLDLKKRVNSDKYRYFKIFSVYFPISLGEDELNEIDGDLTNLATLLHRLQSMDVYYGACRVYQIDEKLVGIYFTQANLPTVFPLAPYIEFHQIEGINDWYVVLRDNRTIKFNDFINAIVEVDYFDANHVIINLDEKQISKLLEKYEVCL